MRRQRKNHQSEDIDINTRQPTNMSYTPLNKESNNMEDFLQMENLTRFNTLEKRPSHRFENTIEAKVEEGDTLQALALRFHCSVADIKRINKIDKDNEIYARKVVKIPVTPHSILLETLPIVHKSGSNSPSQCEDDTLVTNIMKNPLEDARVVLGEKLIVASVNSSSTTSQGTNDINNEIISSKFIRKANAYTEEDRTALYTFHCQKTIKLEENQNYFDFGQTAIKLEHVTENFNMHAVWSNYLTM
ncbi:uncharacterized protein LOC118743526 isoform X2 [Rhagoletis pomonella]|uniref:uncharacterized protein LOC118743526 isoform X2 n=1 Tax=Rhagoletis pomonella TaxID=28610 RepID=UPI00178112A0|nr:uncharacterized protein LOC118743526 isoform X2 [Rhagoletis pomonella]